MSDCNFIETLSNQRKRRRICNREFFQVVDPFIVLYQIVPFLHPSDQCKLSLTCTSYYNLVNPKIEPKHEEIVLMLKKMDTLVCLNRWIEFLDQEKLEREPCTINTCVFLNLHDCWERMKTGEKFDFTLWTPFLKKNKWFGNLIIGFVANFFNEKHVGNYSTNPFTPLIYLIYWRRHYFEIISDYYPIDQFRCKYMTCTCCSEFKFCETDNRRYGNWSVNPNFSYIEKGIIKSSGIKKCCDFNDCLHLSENCLNQLIFTNYDLFALVSNFITWTYEPYDSTNLVFRKDIPIEFVVDYYLKEEKHLRNYTVMEYDGSEEFVYMNAVANGREDIFMKCLEFQKDLFFEGDDFCYSYRLDNIVNWCIEYSSTNCFKFVLDIANQQFQQSQNEIVKQWLDKTTIRFNRFLGNIDSSIHLQ